VCWKIEVWVATKQWKRVGEVETVAQAKEAVLTIAAQYGVARATLQGDAEEGWCGMRAYRGRGFSCWTGSGGLYGA